MVEHYQSNNVCYLINIENARIKPDLLAHSPSLKLTSRVHRAIYALLVINKAGGLIYTRVFPSATNSLPSLSQLSGNDYLILAGTFHGVHAISRQLSPFHPSYNRDEAATSSGMTANRDSAQPLRSNVNSKTAGGPTSATAAGQSRAPDEIPQPAASGIESLQTGRFLLSCYQTPTGVKFLLFSEPAEERIKVDSLLRRCYELYVDYALRNPFYSLEMPIRCEKFERAIQGWVGVR